MLGGDDDNDGDGCDKGNGDGDNNGELKCCFPARLVPFLCTQSLLI